MSAFVEETNNWVYMQKITNCKTDLLRQRLLVFEIVKREFIPPMKRCHNSIYLFICILLLLLLLLLFCMGDFKV